MISIKPTLLVLVYLAPEHRNLLSDRFELLYAPNEVLGVDRSNGQEQINLRGEEIEFVLTNGANGLLPIEIDAMPKLKLICSLGVGFENVAIEHARRCGIPVCNAAGTMLLSLITPWLFC
jgi:D-3-phosphoglycerate dehydrogenase